jgi:hypothetical protein
LRSNVFSEGLLARALGRARGRNPYPLNSDEASLWARGSQSIDDSHRDIPEVWDLPPSLPQRRKAARDAGRRSHFASQIAKAVWFGSLRFVGVTVPLGLVVVLLALAVFKS